jgi:hypothetical protein
MNLSDNQWIDYWKVTQIGVPMQNVPLSVHKINFIRWVEPDRLKHYRPFFVFTGYCCVLVNSILLPYHTQADFAFKLQWTFYLKSTTMLQERIHAAAPIIDSDLLSKLVIRRGPGEHQTKNRPNSLGWFSVGLHLGF